VRVLAASLCLAILTTGCQRKPAKTDTSSEDAQPDGGSRQTAAADEIRLQWLEKWRKNHTLELAQEFLKLYGGDTCREATLMVFDGVEQHLWTGHAAEIDMTTDAVEELLGGCDWTMDHTRDFALSVEPGTRPDPEDPRAMLKVEDIATQGIGLDPDTTPVLVEVLKEVPMPIGGTGSVE
jgi:hypothetical protein